MLGTSAIVIVVWLAGMVLTPPRIVVREIDPAANLCAEINRQSPRRDGSETREAPDTLRDSTGRVSAGPSGDLGRGFRASAADQVSGTCEAGPLSLRVSHGAPEVLIKNTSVSVRVSRTMPFSSGT